MASSLVQSVINSEPSTPMGIPRPAMEINGQMSVLREMRSESGLAEEDMDIDNQQLDFDTSEPLPGVTGTGNVVTLPLHGVTRPKNYGS